MTAKKLHIILLALTFAGLAGLVGCGSAANTLLTKKSASLSALKAQSEVASELQISLKKGMSDIVKYKSLDDIARSVVPQDKDQAQTVSEIVKIANDSGIPKLTSITFPASTLGGTTQATSSITQVTPVKGIPGVYVLPITITQDASRTVPYSQFLVFLKKLETNQRTAQVSAISIQPDAKNPSQISFTLTVNEYIKP